MMSSDFGPVCLSEDAGDTWFELSGVPSVGAYGRRQRLALAYANGYLQPLRATPEAIYIYQWPQLPPLPTLTGTGLLTGTTGTVTFTLPLASGSEDATGILWSAETGAEWLSLTPVTGTLPAELVLEVNADLIATPAVPT